MSCYVCVHYVATWWTAAHYDVRWIGMKTSSDMGIRNAASYHHSGINITVIVRWFHGAVVFSEFKSGKLEALSTDDHHGCICMPIVQRIEMSLHMAESVAIRRPCTRVQTRLHSPLRFDSQDQHYGRLAENIESQMLVNRALKFHISPPITHIPSTKLLPIKLHLLLPPMPLDTCCGCRR